MPLKGNNLLFARSSKRSTSSRVIDGSFLSWTHISKKLIFPLMASLSLWLDIRGFPPFGQTVNTTLFSYKNNQIHFLEISSLFRAETKTFLCFFFLFCQNSRVSAVAVFHFIFCFCCFFFFSSTEKSNRKVTPLDEKKMVSKMRKFSFNFGDVEGGPSRRHNGLKIAESHVF